MREVHLPIGASEGELELAEQVALTLGSQVLVVCWTGRRESVPVRRRPESRAHPLAALMGGMAGAVAEAWDAFIAPLQAQARTDADR
jgi:hypothetical protein